MGRDANPAYLKTPASSVTLAVSAADPELDPLTYNWRLVSAPGGATVSVVNSNSASATANGLTVDAPKVMRAAGLYRAQTGLRS